MESLHLNDVLSGGLHIIGAQTMHWLCNVPTTQLYLRAGMSMNTISGNASLD
jgi:hypothetical protein